MAATDDDMYTALEDAISQWNKQLAEIQPALTDQIMCVKESLLEIRRALAARRALPPALVTARARLRELEDGPPGEEAGVQGMIERVAQLGRTFDAFTRELAQFDATTAALLEGFNNLYPEQTSRPSSAGRAIDIPDLLDATAMAGGADSGENRSPASVASASLSPQEVKRPMGAILLEAGVITRQQLEQALREQRSSWNRHLGVILVSLGYASEESIAQALAAQSRLPFIALAQQEVHRAAIRLVPERLAELHTCMPLRLYGNTLRVAMANPYDLIALEDLRLAANRRIDPVVATAHDIRAAIQLWYAKSF